MVDTPKPAFTTLGQQQALESHHKSHVSLFIIMSYIYDWSYSSTENGAFCSVKDLLKVCEMYI